MSEFANAASVAVIRGERVLLIRRALAPFAGLWTLPGGRCEPGETAAEAAVREVFEELGLAISGLRPLTTLAVQPAWRLAVFATADFSGEISPSAEIGDWQWTSRAAAATLATTPDLLSVLELALPADRPVP